MERWDGIREAEQEALARRLAKELPTGFVFDELRPFDLGGVRRRIALFSGEGVSFAFVPGGGATIGFDVEGWKPAPLEVEDWADTAEEYGVPKSIEQYVAESTLRPRRAEFPPLLVERAADELCWAPIPLELPEVQRLLPLQPDRRRFVHERKDVAIRISRRSDGSVSAHRRIGPSHADVLTMWGASGFRFPTFDEWERLCGGGTTTLFRWGPNAPADWYPEGQAPGRGVWPAAPGGMLGPPPPGFYTDPPVNLRPNAFGLWIAPNPYEYELVQDPTFRRGADGGCTIHGTVGYFVAWLTLATSYFEEQTCRRHRPDRPLDDGFEYGRRVLPL